MNGPQITSLSVRAVRRTPLRYVGLVTLITSCLLVVLIVSELSRASGENLDDSVNASFGGLGTYRIDLVQGLDLPSAVIANVGDSSLRSATHGAVTVIESFGTQDLTCPGYDPHSQSEVVVISGPVGMGQSTGVTKSGDPSPLCLGGVDVSDHTRLSSPQEQRALGQVVVADSALSPELLLVSRQHIPYHFSFVVQTNRANDQSDSLRSALDSDLGPLAIANGSDPEVVTGVTRLDDGAAVRRASDGIHLVYAIIAVALVFVAAAGTLLVQSAAVRERSWFYGLTRAMGASRRDVFSLVVTDVVLVLLASSLCTVALALALQPLARSFATSTFGVGVNLVRTGSLGALLGGTALLLLAAGAVPAFWAARQDPVDVLERR